MFEQFEGTQNETEIIHFVVNCNRDEIKKQREVLRRKDVEPCEGKVGKPVFNKRNQKLAKIS